METEIELKSLIDGLKRIQDCRQASSCVLRGVRLEIPACGFTPKSDDSSID